MKVAESRQVIFSHQDIRVTQVWQVVRLGVQFKLQVLNLQHSSQHRLRFEGKPFFNDWEIDSFMLRDIQNWFVANQSPDAGELMPLWLHWPLRHFYRLDLKCHSKKIYNYVIICSHHVIPYDIFFLLWSIRVWLPLTYCAGFFMPWNEKELL